MVEIVLTASVYPEIKITPGKVTSLASIWFKMNV